MEAFLKTLTPLYEAAKQCGKSAAWIKKELIDTGKLPAYITGGAKRRTFLRVDMALLNAAIRQHCRYQPPAPKVSQSRRPPTRTRSQKIHPAAAAM